jgi:hypothetical protein
MTSPYIHVIGGDVIDITNVAAGQSDDALNDVFHVLGQYRYPDRFHFLIGNHEVSM